MESYLKDPSQAAAFTHIKDGAVAKDKRSPLFTAGESPQDADLGKRLKVFWLLLSQKEGLFTFALEPSPEIIFDIGKCTSLVTIITFVQ